MTSRALVAGLLLVPAIVSVALRAPSAVAAATQERGEPGPTPSDLVDALLATLLEFDERTPEQLQHEVASLGGVAFERPVPVEMLAPADVPGRLQVLFDAEYPPEAARRDARLLAAFGLLPDGYDLRAERFALLRDNVVGFYDDRPRERRLFVVGEGPGLGPSAQMIAVHELRHALQDQHVPTHDALPDTVGAFDDRRLAWMALVEGDALLVMELFLRARLPEEQTDRDLSGFLPSSELPGVPPVLSAQLAAPYAAGHGFVRSLHAARGWDGVRQAWEAPPRSTEQVLHPERFLAGESPRAVEPLAWDPAGGRVEDDGVLGELLTRTLLHGEPDAAAAAAGWGGDLYQLWVTPAGPLLVWRSAWDTPAEQREFVDAVTRVWTHRHGEATVRGRCHEWSAAGRFHAWCDGPDEVRFVSAPDAASRDAARLTVPSTTPTMAPR